MHISFVVPGGGYIMVGYLLPVFLGVFFQAASSGDERPSAPSNQTPDTAKAAIVALEKISKHLPAPLPKKLESLPWSPPNASGLRAVWQLEPKSPTYSLGSVVACRVLVHNSGKQTIEFQAAGWQQDADHEFTDDAGKAIEVNRIFYDGLTPLLKFRLEPNEYCQIGAPGFAIGDGRYEEDMSTARIGTIIKAPQGAMVHFITKIALTIIRPDGSTLARDTVFETGKMTFQVTAAVDEPPRSKIATSPGRYRLADDAWMQITQFSSESKRQNIATILFTPEIDQKPELEYKIALPDGVSSFAIAWVPNVRELWISEDEKLRKLDYTDKRNITETRVLLPGDPASEEQKFNPSPDNP